MSTEPLSGSLQMQYAAVPAESTTIRFSFTLNCKIPSANGERQISTKQTISTFLVNIKLKKYTFLNMQVLER
jgi:hypothetical protein